MTTEIIITEPKDEHSRQEVFVEKEEDFMSIRRFVSEVTKDSNLFYKGFEL